jgi:hypothetical protein
MRAIVAAALAGVLMMPVESGAHRLDEYLQATRVSLARDTIALEIDLTPGANMADEIIAILDRDGDGAVSPAEARAYGESVLRDVALKLDDRPVVLTLSRIEVPPAGDMRGGIGTIQLRATSDVGTVAAGRRRLQFENLHRPASSVYLVNALAPDDRALVVVSQARDVRQQRLGVDYDVRSRAFTQLWWVLLGAAAAIAAVGATWQSSSFATSPPQMRIASPSFSAKRKCSSRRPEAPARLDVGFLE